MQTRSLFSTLLIIIFIGISSSSSFAEVSPDEKNKKGIIFHNGDWESVLTKAESEGKMIFLDAYASWCGPCKWMSKNVFTDPKVAEFFNKNFINAKVDMELGEGIQLAKQFEVRAYPTLLFLSKEGAMLHRVCGAREVSDFIAQGEIALDPPSGFYSKMSEFQASEASAAEMRAMLVEFESACVDNSIIMDAYFEEFSPLPSDENEESGGINEENWKLIQDYADDPESKAMFCVYKYYSDFRKAFTTNAVDVKIFSTFETGFSRAIRKKDKSKMERLDELINSLDSKDKERLSAYSEMQNFKFDELYDDYAQFLIGYLEQFPTNEPKELNKYAWEFYEKVEDNEKLEKAIEWALRSVDLDRGYYNLDTVAALFYKIDNKEQAINYAEQAIEMAKEQDVDYTSTQQLLEKINTLK